MDVFRLRGEYSSSMIIHGRTGRSHLLGAHTMNQNHSTPADFPAQAWFRSTACDPQGGNCVEVNVSVPNRVAVRDAKPRRPVVLVFESPAWRGFLASLCDSHVKY